MELSALSSLAGGSTVAVLAIIIFYMYRNDKLSEAEKLKQEKAAETERLRDEHDAEVTRWQEQIEKYDTINKELIACREADNHSRESLAKNLGELAESIRSCGLRGGRNDQL